MDDNDTQSWLSRRRPVPDNTTERYYSPLPPSDSDGSRPTLQTSSYDSVRHTGNLQAGPRGTPAAAVQGYAQKRQCASMHPVDEYSEQQPLLGVTQSDKTTGLEKEDGLTRDGARNMATAMVIASFMMVGSSMFDDTSTQWLYRRFQEEVLGPNITLLNTTTTRNPCLHGSNKTSPYVTQLDRAQAMASTFGVWIQLISLVPAFFTNMLLGAYSDRIGRRIIFILPQAGHFVKYAVTCAVAKWNLNIFLLFVGFGVYGAGGTSLAFAMGMYVYTADNTGRQKSRSFFMVLAQTVIMIFYSLSHLAVGVFIDRAGYLWPMVTALCLCVVALLGTIIFLRETLHAGHTKECVNVFQGIKDVFSFYLLKSQNPRYKRKDFLVVGLIFLLFGTCIAVNIQTLYLMNEPLCWGAEKIGTVTTIQGLIAGFASIGLMFILQKVISDEVICVASLLSAAGGHFLLAFAEYDWMIYAAFTVSMLELLVLAILRAVLSRMVPIHKRGSLFASIAVIEVGTLALAGAGLNELYSGTVAYWHGLTYFVIGCCCLVSAAMMVCYIIMVRRRDLTRALVVEEAGEASPSSCAINGDLMSASESYQN